tara:strand:- start:322 stop:462 length:141 start_codon:yes stop_codon:yes gene_type:complete
LGIGGEDREEKGKVVPGCSLGRKVNIDKDKNILTCPKESPEGVTRC